MARSSGVLEKRGARKWLIRVDLGRDGNGKRRRLNRTVNGSKKDAEQVLRELLRERDLGTLTQPSQQTLDEYLDHWLAAAARPRLEEGTYHAYAAQLTRYVRPTLGGLKVAQVQPVAIQKVYADMLARGLSPRTVRYAHAVLSSALKQAVKWRLLPTNPADAVELPKSQKKEMRALTPDEAARFLRATEASCWHVLFSVLLGTGLRPGEALALRWQDLDLPGERLFVRRSASKVKGEWVFRNGAKTAKGTRTVDLPAGLTRQLADLPQDAELLFSTAPGTPPDLSAITRRHFKPAVARAGIEGNVRLYDLRHTHATLLLLAGEHPKVVSERLGHADITLTLNTYSHVLPGMQREGAAKLDAMLYQEAPPAVLELGAERPMN